jgi:hypothetical protein
MNKRAQKERKTKYEGRLIYFIENLTSTRKKKTFLDFIHFATKVYTHTICNTYLNIYFVYALLIIMSLKI